MSLGPRFSSEFGSKWTGGYSNLEFPPREVPEVWTYPSWVYQNHFTTAIENMIEVMTGPMMGHPASEAQTLPLHFSYEGYFWRSEIP